MTQINKQHFVEVLAILQKHEPNAQIWFFGSRTGGSAQKYSDLDILIKTKNDKKKRAALIEDFENSNIPFKIDLVFWDKVNNEFRDMILEKALPLEKVIEEINHAA